MDVDEHFAKDRDEPHGACEQMSNDSGAYGPLKRMIEDEDLYDQDARDKIAPTDSNVY